MNIELVFFIGIFINKSLATINYNCCKNLKVTLLNDTTNHFSSYAGDYIAADPYFQNGRQYYFTKNRNGQRNYIYYKNDNGNAYWVIGPNLDDSISPYNRIYIPSISNCPFYSNKWFYWHQNGCWLDTRNAPDAKINIECEGK